MKYEADLFSAVGLWLVTALVVWPVSIPDRNPGEQ